MRRKQKQEGEIGVTVVWWWRRRRRRRWWWWSWSWWRSWSWRWRGLVAVVVHSYDGPCTKHHDVCNRYLEQQGGDGSLEAQEALHILEGWRINTTARSIEKKKKQKQKSHRNFYE